MEITLSPHQLSVASTIVDWFKAAENTSFLTLGGYAGTGKTTLVGYVTQMLRKQHPELKIAFCSFTGKAVRTLQSKLDVVRVVRKGDQVSTIHRLLYSPVTNDQGDVIGWERIKRGQFPFGLIIVDEASMVSRNIWDDLQDCGVPILAVGDHGQLPPIEGNFNLMDNPQLRLEEIYRQVRDNPIIELSLKARTEGFIPFGTYGKGVRKLPRADSDSQEFVGELLQSRRVETLVLVGYNSTRVKLNTAIRGLWEMESQFPQLGDKVICLRTNYKKRIYNGMVGIVTSVDTRGQQSDVYDLTVVFDEDNIAYTGSVAAAQFNAKTTLPPNEARGLDLFDYGYALTVHKAQGSQAERVVVFEERFPNMDDATWARWLYTAVTRASSELYILG